MPTARLILWTGPKHSGKSAAAAELARRAAAVGFAVAGILAPSVPGGYDLLDLRSAARTPLARRGRDGDQRAGRFAFCAAGLDAGAGALDAAVDADLVIVDEFGPLELAGGGWRAAVDGLIRSARGTILLVVREELAATVGELWSDGDIATIDALAPEAADRVLDLLQRS